MMKRAVSFIAILVADILSLILSFYSAYYLRVEIIPRLFYVENPWFFPMEHFQHMYYLLFVFIVIFFYEKLYTRRYDVFREFVYITRGLVISVIFIAVLVYLSRTFEAFSRTIPVLMVMTGMVIIPLVRFVVKKVLMVTGFYIKKAVVVGSENETTLILPTLKKMETSGYKIIQVVEPLEDDISLPDNVDTLFIVAEGIRKERLNRLINQCENHVKEIKILSDSRYLKTMGVETEYIEELLLMRMANNLLSPVNRFFKRLFDLSVSLVAIVLLLPVLLLIALLIKLTSRGSVLFIQERFGKDGKQFKFIKFRSMYPDSDQRLKNYLDRNSERQAEWERYKKLKSRDPRVTPIGKLLRRFSLDEAPQLFNVLIGDMSIVGPRPYLIREKEEIEKSAAIIFRVKSGLTGLWQVKGRNELSFETRLKLDEFYVRNWSFLLDIVIILKTFGAVLKGKGAY